MEKENTSTRLAASKPAVKTKTIRFELAALYGAVAIAVRSASDRSKRRERRGEGKERAEHRGGQRGERGGGGGGGSSQEKKMKPGFRSSPSSPLLQDRSLGKKRVPFGRCNASPTGNRTRNSTVKTWYHDHLTIGDSYAKAKKVYIEMTGIGDGCMSANREGLGPWCWAWVGGSTNQAFPTRAAPLLSTYKGCRVRYRPSPSLPPHARAQLTGSTVDRRCPFSCSSSTSARPLGQ